MEACIQTQGDKMYTELNEKKKLNADAECVVDELSIEVTKLNNKIKGIESESNELKNQCQQLINDKGNKLDHIKTLSNEIAEISDRLDEASHIIASLKKKNSRREKDINHMAQKADKLMKKYSELKEKSIYERQNYLKNKKEMNLAIGSRMMDYLLHKAYFKRMKKSMNLVRGFSQFDDNFFNSTRRLMRMFENKLELKIKNYFHQWYMNT